MRSYAFRILDVFAIEGVPFSGNPLAVVEDGEGLSAGEMQRIARQFNLSETTFILPATAPGATARVRIFTPTFEMPFAGHPTLGTAHVVREQKGGDRRVRLEMLAGLVDVEAHGDTWTLKAAVKPSSRPPAASRAELASMLGVAVESVGEPLWVDTGAEQLIVPLADEAAVRSARPDAALLARHGYSEKRGASMAYVWARVGGDGKVVARFFFLANGGVVEDPATGSACANLGGWMLGTGCPVPLRLDVRQGEMVARPSQLELHVDADEGVFVTGLVAPFGRGTITVG